MVNWLSRGTGRYWLLFYLVLVIAWPYFSSGTGFFGLRTRMINVYSQVPVDAWWKIPFMSVYVTRRS